MKRSRKRQKRGWGCALGAGIGLLLLICGLAGAWFFYKKYMPSNELADKQEVFGIRGEEVAIILDNQLQPAKGIYEEGQVYLPIDWVNEFVNQRFYWSDYDQQLMYTLPDHTVYADAETEGNAGHLLKAQEDGVYLSLGLILSYTDVRAEAFDSSQIKRVYVDTLWEPEQQAQLKSKGKLREKGGVKSPIIAEAQKGDTVTILETMEKWSRVRSQDGYIGYIENRRLTEGEAVTPVSSFEDPVYTSISMEEPVVLAFHQVTVPEANDRLEELLSDASGINVLVPTWFTIEDSQGNYSSLASHEYVEQAHAKGIQVWGMLNNVSTAESVQVNTRELMGPLATRKKLIDSLMADAAQYDLDGINLDFESLKAEAGPHYVQFIRELSVACREAGLVLSIDNYVPSSYTDFYNRREQGAVADYVIIMGYDEHYAGGEAGSVASLDYVKQGIEKTLEQVPAEKVINGVPFYTRIWTIQGENTSSRALGIGDAKKWVEENEVELTWQEDLGQYYGQCVNADGEDYIWMEEERSLGLKMDEIISHQLAGVACWKLGFETAEIWDVISRIQE